MQVNPAAVKDRLFWSPPVARPHHMNPASTVTCRIASMYIQFCTTHDVPGLTRNMPCGPIVNSGSSPVFTLTLPVATEQRRLLFASGSSVNVPPEWIVSMRNDTSSQTGTTWLVERKALEKAMSGTVLDPKLPTART
jgi:hypothetical protein